MNSQSQPQNYSTASGVNFDVKEQNFISGQYGVPIAGRYSYPRGGDGNAIGEYKIPPTSGQAIFDSQGGNINWLQIPQSGNYVVVVQNGRINFVQAPSGSLQLFNNQLGWTPTEACE